MLFGATLTSLLLFLMNLHVALLWLLALAVVMGAAFTRWELRAADPFIDVRVFAGNVPLLITYARSVLVAVVSYSFLYGFTQWVEDGRGLSPSQAGLVLLPTFAVGIVVATTTGPRPQIRGKLIVGAATQIVACTLLLFVHSATPVVFLLAIAVVLGIPQGLLSLAVQNTLYHQAEPARIGASSGLLRTFMYLGAMIAAAATGASFGTTADTAGLHSLAIVMITAAALLLLITLIDPSLVRVDRQATAQRDQDAPER